MKNLKKVLSLILALSMVLCFAACGEEEPVNVETEEVVEEAVAQVANEPADTALAVVEGIFSGNAMLLFDSMNPDVLAVLMPIDSMAEEDLTVIADDLNAGMSEMMAQYESVDAQLSFAVTAEADVALEEMDLSICEAAAVEVEAAKTVTVTLTASSEQIEEDYVQDIPLTFVMIDGVWYLDPSTMATL